MTIDVEQRDQNRTALQHELTSAITSDPVSRAALMIICAIALVAALDAAQVIFAPICMSIIVGSIIGPVTDRIVRFGVPAWIAAIAMVFLFLLLIFVVGAALVVPLSDWMDKLPLIWSQFQSQLVSWKSVFTSISALQEELRGAVGGADRMQVSVVDGATPVEDVFFFAPTFLAQVVLFLAGLYFFTLTRPFLRRSAQQFSQDRESQKYILTTFRTIEERLSSYLFSITLINLCLGAMVALVMWFLGVPSPLLWGILASILNYVIYIGPAVMLVIMAGVGLATGNTVLAILTPPLAYLAINMIEAQFVTPTVLGRTMTLNPFIVFLTIAFWIWLWGPVGGFVAVPLLLVAVSVLEIMANVADRET
ncbi:MAG: AI-2E family transporter [Rhodobacteraceae bacterium]|nr:AI-2E family transporter [Paracoccaceae bacterium]